MKPSCQAGSLEQEGQLVGTVSDCLKYWSPEKTRRSLFSSPVCILNTLLAKVMTESLSESDIGVAILAPSSMQILLAVRALDTCLLLVCPTCVESPSLKHLESPSAAMEENPSGQSTDAGSQK